MSSYILGPDYTLAQQVALSVSGKSPDLVVRTTVRPVMIRVPVNDVLRLDAMAQLDSKSRSQMAVLLLRVGIEAVLQEMEPDAIERFHDVIASIAQSVVTDPDNQDVDSSVEL